MSKIWLELASRIKQLKSKKEFLPLHEPVFKGNEQKYVADCISTGWVSSVGKYVDEFERSLAGYIGVKRAVAVVNGTAALHIALKVAGVRSGDEVLMPSLTFIATGNAVAYCGASPHFIDVSEATLGIDPIKLGNYLDEIAEMQNNVCVNKKTGNIIRAVIPMHTFGHSVDLDPLIKICEQFNIALIEDAAESLGSFYKGKHTGSFGIASAISFNGNKIITTGGGGAIITNNEKLADYAKHITTTAKKPHSWEYDHDEIGYNYRMPNINAAMGLAQLEQIDNFIENKRVLAERYQKIINDFDGLELFKEPVFSKSNYWLQTIIINDQKYNINEGLKLLNDSGVMARPIWKPLHVLNPYRECPKSDLSITEKLKHQIINLPSSSYLGI